MKKNNFNKKRLDILNILKKNIIIDGWNENLFKKNKVIKKYTKREIVSLFPEGYTSLLKFYLSNADNEMVQGCQKLNLAKITTHEKVNAIILLKLKKNQRDKDLVKRTFFTLLLPHHSKLLTYSIQNTVNKIWYIAGDFSKDYNYYSKRLILASIYSTTVFYWLNNKIDYLIIGSLAIKNISETISIANEFENKIYISLDQLNNKIMINGLVKKSNIGYKEIIKIYNKSNIKGFVITDISRDGMMQGINLKLVNQNLSITEKPMIIGGGLSSYEDLKNLKKLNQKNLEGVISGKSFYSGAIEIKKGIKIIS